MLHNSVSQLPVGLGEVGDVGHVGNAGASAVSDIAFAVATELDYLRVLTAAGLDLETAARQITFSTALGCRFYLAVAKIRAARKLWADVIDACGGSAQRMCLRVATAGGC